MGYISASFAFSWCFRLLAHTPPLFFASSWRLRAATLFVALWLARSNTWAADQHSRRHCSATRYHPEGTGAIGCSARVLSHQASRCRLPSLTFDAGRVVNAVASVTLSRPIDCGCDDVEPPTTSSTPRTPLQPSCVGAMDHRVTCRKGSRHMHRPAGVACWIGLLCIHGLRHGSHAIAIGCELGCGLPCLADAT